MTNEMYEQQVAKRRNDKGHLQIGNSHKTLWIIGGVAVLIVAVSVTVTTVVIRSFFGYSLSEPDGTINGYDYADLGLPSGTLWATCNVSASRPDEDGCYFSWADVIQHSDSSWDYRWENTPYCPNMSIDTWSKYNGSDGRSVLDTEDDAAAVAWGDPWRMPTLDEVRELIDKCRWKWKKVNGMNGYIVVGPNGHSIFLPASGCRFSTNIDNDSTAGYYWSGSLNTDNPYGAYDIYFNQYEIEWGSYFARYYGQSVRPVCVVHDK